MVFNKFDVTLQVGAEYASGESKSVDLRIPAASTEELDLIQRFSELWKRGEAAQNECTSGSLSITMQLHRAWYDDGTVEPEEPKPEEVSRKTAAQAPKRRGKKATETTAAEEAKPQAAAKEETAGNSAAVSHNEGRGFDLGGGGDIPAAPAVGGGGAKTDRPLVMGADEQIHPSEEQGNLFDQADAEPKKEPKFNADSDLVMGGWAALKAGDITKDRIWNYSCACIPEESQINGAKVPLAGERLLFSAACGYVLTDPMIKRDAGMTLDKVKAVYSADLDTLDDWFAPGRLGGERRIAADAYESFKGYSWNDQASCQNALIRRFAS